MILPGLIGVYNMIIARTFIQNSILMSFEAARWTAHPTPGSFSRWCCRCPACWPLALYCYHWNAYFSALLYISDRSTPAAVPALRS